MAFGLKHLFGLKGLASEDITAILDTAVTFREVLDRPIRIVPTLKGVAVLNLFYEDSTRTRISFELAEKRLNAEVVTFAKSASSVSKGESFRDTVRNIEAMKIDVIVCRHSSPGAPQFLAKHTACTVINAGDGSHEHPTQALLDMLTIRERFGKLAGLKVLIVGDILHSRVARSDIWGMKTMGAEVAVCGPATLMPLDMSALDVPVHYDRLGAPYGYGSKGRNQTFYCRKKLKVTLEACLKELFELWGRDPPSIILTAGVALAADLLFASQVTQAACFQSYTLACIF